MNGVKIINAFLVLILRLKTNLAELFISQNCSIIDQTDFNFSYFEHFTPKCSCYPNVKEGDTKFNIQIECTELDLSSNELNSSSMPAFENMTSLQILKLDQNLIEKIDDNLFVKLNLKTLSLARNRLKIIYQNTFNGLQCLEILNLYSNQISIVEKNAFFHLYSLKELNLWENKLETLPDKMFSSNNSLLTLQMSSNKLTVISRLALANLRLLETLNLQDNKISVIEQGAFDDLKNLKHLDLSENEIKAVQKNLFLNAKKLESINFNFNRKIVRLESVTFFGLFNLSQLSFVSCSIQDIDDDAFVSLINLTNLNMKGNKLEQVPKALSSLINLNDLYLSQNNISVVRKTDFKNLNLLKFLQMEANFLKVIEDGAMDPLMNLIELHLWDNSIETISNKTFNLPKLVILNLSGNKILKLDANVFSKLADLYILVLDQNENLSFVDANAFNGLTNVTSITLSDNNINMLPATSFQSLKSLISLDLSRTKIRSLTFNHFKYTKNLEKLYLNGLELDDFPDEIFDLIKFNAVFVEKTKFDCTKNLTRLVDWLGKLKGSVICNTQGSMK